jgi:hypothetical protein
MDCESEANLMNHTNFIETLRAKVEQVAAYGISSRHLVSAFLYGGNVESIRRGEALISSEVDLLAIVSARLSPGEAPLPNEAFRNFCQGMTVEGREMQLIFNGVPPINCDRKLVLLDVIGDGLPNILEGDASSVIVAHKPRIAIYGKDVYARLEKIPVDSKIRRILFETAKKYVSREFLGRHDPLGGRGVAKNTLFLASLLDEHAIRHSNKREIAQIVRNKFPELETHLDYFAEILDSDDRATDGNALSNHFEAFCALYERHCR